MSTQVMRQPAVELDQLLRCYLDPLMAIDAKAEERRLKREKRKKGGGGGEGGGGKAQTEIIDQYITEYDELENKWCGPCLVFDTETTTSPESGQKARFGFFQMRGPTVARRVELLENIRRCLDKKQRAELTASVWTWLDGLPENGEGVFYDPNLCDESEVALIKTYAARHKLRCVDVQHFVRNVLYKRYWLKAGEVDGTELHKLVIGLNLPFDFGALSTHAGHSRDANLYGALSLKLNTGHKTNLNFPRIKIKKIGFAKHFYGFNARKNFTGDAYEDADFTKVESGGVVKQFYKTGIHVVDCTTIGRALIGKGSLRELCKALNTKTKKIDFEPSGAITEEFLDYARADVQATWEVYVKLRDIYAKYGLEKKLWGIYSGASLGKAHLEAMGVPRFFKQSKKGPNGEVLLDPGVFNCPGFDKKYLGYAAETFYGGRSEVRVRLQERVAMLLDFKSEYPTVNALMKIQELILSKNVKCVEDDPGTLEFLQNAQLNDFKKRDTWPKLRGFAKIKPNGDVLPFRGNYTKDAANIGVNIIESAEPIWYSLADVIASKLITGRLPEIVQTLTLVPSEERHTAQPFNIMGNPDYRVDPNSEDIFVAVINLRTKIKSRIGALDKKIKTLKDAGGPVPPELSAEFSRLKGEEGVVKELANGTSYGIHVELNINDRPDIRECHIYYGDGDKKQFVRSKRVTDMGGEVIDPSCLEAPGKYYSPYGGLIPAAGRLLLAIAEVLGRERQLSYIFADTDSMCYCPGSENLHMTHEEFTSRVKDISDWYQDLNPYDGADRIFKIEDVNYSLKDDISGKNSNEFQPLYGIAISAKRYCLYNIRDSRIIIRKLTAHGLGALKMPPEYRAACPEPAQVVHIAAPEKTNEHGETYRDYNEISHCSEARLALDMWLIAIQKVRAGGPDVLGDIRLELMKIPFINLPVMGQRTLASRDDYTKYAKLGGFRAFQFFNTLPPPKPISDDVDFCPRVDIRKELLATSLYCGGLTGDKREKTPVTEDEWRAIGLKRRDNGEFPAELFHHDEYQLRFSTAFDLVRPYFQHGEAKSYPPDGVGELQRRRVICRKKMWIGKETNPLLEMLEDENAYLDDNDYFDHPRSNVLIGREPVAHIKDLRERLIKYGRFEEVSAALDIADFTLDHINNFAKYSRISDAGEHIADEAKRIEKKPASKRTADEKRLVRMAASEAKQLEKFVPCLQKALDKLTNRTLRIEQRKRWHEAEKLREIEKAANAKSAFKRQRFLAVIAQDRRCSCLDPGYNPERTFRGWLKARAGFAARLDQIAIDRRMPDGTNEPALDPELVERALKELAAQCGLPIPKVETAPQPIELYYGGVSERDVGGRTLTFPVKKSWIDEIAAGGPGKVMKDETRPAKRGTGDEKRLCTWAEFVTEETRRVEEGQAHDREAERLKKQRQRAEREAEEARRAEMTPEERAAEKAAQAAEFARGMAKLGFSPVKALK